MVSLIMILEKNCCVWRQAPVIVKVKVWRKAFCILFFNSWGKVKVWPNLLNKLVQIHQFSLSTGHGSTGRTNYESTPERGQRGKNWCGRQRRGRPWPFFRLFSTVRFQMIHKSACIRGSKVTLIALVWLFSNVRFQMCPQINFYRRGIVTLVTFVWLFSTVRYKMSFQMVCFTRCKVTLVAFVWPFSTVF